VFKTTGWLARHIKSNHAVPADARPGIFSTLDPGSAMEKPGLIRDKHLESAILFVTFINTIRFLVISRFIQELGKALGLRHDTMATAAVYFHRFYMFHSFIEFPRYVSLLHNVL
jgi:hypothetical protein